MNRALDLMGNVDGGHHMVEVAFDVYDIANRIQRGDESGWRGDPSASLMFNPLINRFEVWMTLPTCSRSPATNAGWLCPSVLTAIPDKPSR